MTCPNCTSMQAHYGELLEKYHALVQDALAMKREGFTPEIRGEPIVVEYIDPDIRLAVAEVAVPGSSTARQLFAIAEEMLKAGKPVEDVAAAIRKGEEVSL